MKELTLNPQQLAELRKFLQDVPWRYSNPVLVFLEAVEAENSKPKEGEEIPPEQPN